MVIGKNFKNRPFCHKTKINVARYARAKSDQFTAEIMKVSKVGEVSAKSIQVCHHHFLNGTGTGTVTMQVVYPSFFARGAPEDFQLSNI